MTRDLVDPEILKMFFNFITEGNKKLVLELIVANPSLLHATGQQGQTALHMAAVSNKADIAKILIGNGASINAKDNEGKTAFDIAHLSNSEETKLVINSYPQRSHPSSGVIKITIDLSKAEEIEEYNLENLLEAIQRNDLTEIANILKENNSLLLEKNESGLTPLEFALKVKNSQVINSLRKETEQLLSSKASNKAEKKRPKFNLHLKPIPESEEEENPSTSPKKVEHSTLLEEEEKDKDLMC